MNTFTSDYRRHMTVTHVWSLTASAPSALSAILSNMTRGLSPTSLSSIIHPSFLLPPCFHQLHNHRSYISSIYDISTVFSSAQPAELHFRIHIPFSNYQLCVPSSRTSTPMKSARLKLSVFERNMLTVSRYVLDLFFFMLTKYPKLLHIILHDEPGSFVHRLFKMLIWLPTFR